MERIFEIVRYFLKMGCFGFGGPFAVMASFQKDLVEDRAWTDSKRFQFALTFIKVLPGPLATQLAIFLGWIRGGRFGGFLAGTLLLVPAFFAVLILAIFYHSTFFSLKLSGFMAGMQIATIFVIAASVAHLAKPFVKDILFLILATGSFFITFHKASLEPFLIVGLGVLGTLLFLLFGNLRTKTKSNILRVVINKTISRKNIKYFIWIAAFAVFIKISQQFIEQAYWLSVSQKTLKLIQLSWTCFKAGAFTFGTGLAIVPMLGYDFVEKWHWMSHQEFIDGLAFGQITPGPVLVSVTFYGYRVAGLVGAIVATFWVFAPAFFNMLVWFPWIERKLSGQAWISVFMKWAMAAVVGSIAAVTVKLGQEFLVLHHSDGMGINRYVITNVMCCLLMRVFLKTPPWLLIVVSGIVGTLFLH